MVGHTVDVVCPGRVTLVVGLSRGRVVRLPRRNYEEAAATVVQRYDRAEWVVIESFPEGRIC